MRVLENGAQIVGRIAIFGFICYGASMFFTTNWVNVAKETVKEVREISQAVTDIKNGIKDFKDGNIKIAGTEYYLNQATEQLKQATNTR